MTAQPIPGTTAADVIPRDRWGRPLIVPPAGGKPTAYTRVSTLAKALDDQTTLMDWKCRMTAKGIAARDDLRALVAGTTDRRTLATAVKSALETAQADRAANIGTALHSYTEHLDNGGPIEDVPAEYHPHMDAYQSALSRHNLTVVAAEQFIVNDAINVAGTLDRLLLWDGRLVVGDIKTGAQPNYFSLATAMQVACYARGAFYNVTTAERTPLPVDTSVGLLIHLPQDRPECTIYSLDLAEGWIAALMAFDVRVTRKKRLHTAL